MVFIKEDVPVKIFSSEYKLMDSFFFEQNFYNKKWLVCCSFNPKDKISIHLETLRKSLDL